MNYSVLDMDSSDERAKHKVVEPQHMNRDEILQWYMEQPRGFRLRHRARIRELSEQLLIDAILSAVEEVYPHTYAKKAVAQ